jgi:hypothetical protein
VIRSGWPTSHSRTSIICHNARPVGVSVSMSPGVPSSTMKGLAGGSSSFYTPFDGISYGYNGQSQTCFVAGTPQLNPGGTGTVVGVTISGPSTVPITSSVQLTATGNPTGGTYSWTASNSDVTLTNASTATVTVAGSAAGTSVVTVTYTQNEMKGTAMQSVTVQQPNYFVTSSYTRASLPAICTSSGYPGFFLNLSNFVADQNGNQVNLGGITPEEALNGGSMGSYSTPLSTSATGTVSDTPFGACYNITGQFCANGPTLTHAAMLGQKTYPIPTIYKSRQCTEGE